ncbi:MAG: hypothetical protein ACP5HM_12480 [Anaerolineae bacterium]
MIADFLNRSAALLEVIIQDGIGAGEFTPTEARKAARTLDALLNGTVLHWVLCTGGGRRRGAVVLRRPPDIS